MELAAVVARHEHAFLDLEAEASQPYGRFVYADSDESETIRRFLFDQGLCEFSPPYGRLLIEGGSILGMITCLPGEKARDIRLRAALALTKAGFLDQRSPLRHRVQLAAKTLIALHAGDYYLSRIAVVRSDRRRGIGSRLIEHFEEEGRKLGSGRLILEVDPATEDAVRFYHRHGFREIEHRHVVDPDTGRSLEYLHMAKAIAQPAYAA
jgi:ribosomal protein S18 acetylase RimI-like enzyme